jgi:hypothetical protein
MRGELLCTCRVCSTISPTVDWRGPLRQRVMPSRLGRVSRAATTSPAAAPASRVNHAEPVRAVRE